ncbi:putative thioredoxin [Gregarina niphandrodes]|uniref:Thioredoxin n=1 Tax=Gregarina niphandrodes TaxID=110365 RepID=A0A023B3Z6_GRENI|nr:putative thioredoxin [Gregarina niphandrodes]EZG56109.1 putative thioredoxin [Gregarina niphandrodes]|eukprot:XP_011131342.1 putative thioredoxin [Gregarina niphandrodes]
MRVLAVLTAGLLAVLPECSGALVDPLRNEVIALNPRNIMDSFKQYRDRFPGGILFYKDPAKVEDILTDYWEPLSQELKGIARFGAVDCTAHSSLCEHELEDMGQLDASGYVVSLYPSLPRPPRALDKLPTKEKLKSRILKLVPQAKYTNLVTLDDASNYFKVDANIPKAVLYLSDKEEPPTFWHALAHTFGDRMAFSFIGKNGDKTIAQKLGLSLGTPTVAVKTKDTRLSSRSVEQKILKKRPINFQEIQDWLNVHSETFARGGGVDLKVGASSPDRPWLREELPQLTKASHKDLCFGLREGFCAVYSAGPDDLNETGEDLRDSVKDRLTVIKAEVKRPVLKFSWVNAEKEKEVAGSMKLANGSFVIINPHKRLRYSTLEDASTVQHLFAFIDKIKSGDGKFVPLKQVPTFVGKQKQPDEL